MLFRSLSAVLCTLSLGECIAFADETTPLPRVLVLVDTGADALYQRLRQEMESLGLEVTTAKATDNLGVGLEAQARGLGAIAAVRVSAISGGQVDMTIVDRATGKTVNRRLSVDKNADPAATELVAIRTIELLRASLLELQATHPQRGEVAAPGRLKEIVAESYRPAELPAAAVQVRAPGRYPVSNVSLLVGGDVTFTRGWSGGWGLGFGASARLARSLALEGMAQVPLSAMKRTGVGGEVSLNLALGRAGLRFMTTQEPLRFGCSMGGMLVHLSSSAEALPAYAAHSENLTAAGPYAAVFVAVGVHRAITLRFEQSEAYLLPDTIVRFAGVPTASFARP